MAGVIDINGSEFEGMFDDMQVIRGGKEAIRVRYRPDTSLSFRERIERASVLAHFINITVEIREDYGEVIAIDPADHGDQELKPYYCD